MSLIVANMKKAKEIMSDPNAVYIGRTNNSELHYGNPFTHIPSVKGIHVRSRGEAIGRYQSWLAGITDVDVEPRRRDWIIKNLDRLRNKIAVCWCAPALCHGNALGDMLDHKQLSIGLAGSDLGLSESADMITHGEVLIGKYTRLGYRIKLVGVGDTHGRIAASLFNNGLASQLDLQLSSSSNVWLDNEVKLAVAGGANVVDLTPSLNTDVLCVMSGSELSQHEENVVQSYDLLKHGLKSIYNSVCLDTVTGQFTWCESKKPIDVQGEMSLGLF